MTTHVSGGTSWIHINKDEEKKKHLEVKEANMESTEQDLFGTIMQGERRRKHSRRNGARWKKVEGEHRKTTIE